RPGPPASAPSGPCAPSSRGAAPPALPRLAPAIETPDRRARRSCRHLLGGCHPGHCAALRCPQSRRNLTALRDCIRTCRGILPIDQDQLTRARVPPVTSARRSASASRPLKCVTALPRYQTSWASLLPVTGSIHSRLRIAATAS